MSPPADNFPACLAFVWAPDRDGQPYHVDANDPGGATAWGVTHETWEDARGSGLVSGDLADASRAGLATVLRTNYYDRCHCDQLSPGPDLAVFNMAMLSGDGEAERILQIVLGVTVDGVIGPITLAAANAMDPTVLIEALTTRDEAFFASLPGARYFQRGWDRRADDCRVAALAMVATA